MKYIAFILVIVLISITFCTPQQDNKSKEQWKEIICPNCNGLGKVKASTGHKVALGLITFGMGAMCETTECDMCQGTGIVKRRVLNSVELKEE